MTFINSLYTNLKGSQNFLINNFTEKLKPSIASKAKAYNKRIPDELTFDQEAMWSLLITWQLESKPEISNHTHLLPLTSVKVKVLMEALSTTIENTQ